MGESGGSGDPDIGGRNLKAAAALWRGLTEGGVRRAVLSPGSRSSPLALSAHLCPWLETRMLPDERSAAFFALGEARAEARPVAVVATSGTGPANWYPAVIEASMDQVPLVLVSADRPPELLHTGANQTIDQDHLFGSYPRDFLQLPAPERDEEWLYLSTGRRAADRSLWPDPGPVHVNFAFREPLLPRANMDGIEWPAPAAGDPQRPRVSPDPAAILELVSRLADGPGAIVCGRSHYPAGFAPAISALADRLGCPVIADPLSNLRWGCHDRERLVTAADIFLRRAAGGPQPAWILQFGAVPTSQAVQDWVETGADSLVLVTSDGDRPDPCRRSSLAIHGDPESVVTALLDRELGMADGDWWARWLELDAAARDLVMDPALRPPEADVIDALEAALAPGTALFVGSSMPIRSMDAFARGRSDPLIALGNRGASGIDGCVSTFAGLANCRPSVGLLGDLALYHDMNGLLAARDIPGKLVVIDNGGGGIFGLLPYRDHADFERLWRTPTGLDCGQIAALYGLAHRMAAPGADLAATLAEPNSAGKMCLVEVPVDAEQSWDRHRALWNAASNL